MNKILIGLSLLACLAVAGCPVDPQAGKIATKNDLNGSWRSEWDSGAGAGLSMCYQFDGDLLIAVSSACLDDEEFTPYGPVTVSDGVYHFTYSMYSADFDIEWKISYHLTMRPDGTYRGTNTWVNLKDYLEQSYSVIMVRR